MADTTTATENRREERSTDRDRDAARSCVERFAAEHMLLDPAVLEEERIERVQSLLPDIRTLGPPFRVTPTTLQNIDTTPPDPGQGRDRSVAVEKSVETEKKERGVTDFVQYFSNRLDKLSGMLMQRRALNGAVSITNVADQAEGEPVTFTGIVDEKRMVKNDRAVLTVSDMTGTVKVLTQENVGVKVLPDDVIGVTGSVGSDIIYADELIYPDIPLMKDAATTDEEVYAVFLSDLHVGSENYLAENMHRFINWLNSDDPVAEKTKYVVMAGDVVEGIGVYSGQRDELVQEDIYKQYEQFEDLVLAMPDTVDIVVSPGNHDIVRLAEPQPPLPQDAVPRLHDKENVYLVSNPATVTLHGHNGEGVRVLIYHGTSFDKHVDELPHLRRDNPYAEPSDALADYLKRRHLAPMYGSAHIAPRKEDALVIDKPPDIFVTGHLHTFSLSNYRSTNVICAGTFQEQTPFQRRMGHIPDPGKAALVNLQTREFLYKVF